MAIGPMYAPSGLLPASSPPLSLLKAPRVRATPQERGAGDRWQNGIHIEPEPCSLNLDWSDIVEEVLTDVPYWWDCAATFAESPASVLAYSQISGTKKIADNEDAITVEAWTAWVGKTCTGLGMASAREAEEQAILLRRWNASIDAIVEHELWSGQVAQAAGFDDNVYLADPVNATSLGGNFGFITALAELEQALADLVSLGPRMIHAQSRLVTAWIAYDLVEPSPDRTYLQTKLGTVVVPGGGYPGTDPNGVDPSYSHTYAYGTGQVKVFVGDPVVNRVDATTVDRSTNDVELRAEAPVAIIFNPCALVTVGVNLCDSLCGGGS